MSHGAQPEYVGALVVPVVRPSEGWELYEGKVPVSELHDHAVDLLRHVLQHWAKKTGARIVCDLAVRWIAEDARIGINPDVGVLLPPPPVGALELTSVRTWLEGHEPPLLGIEIVSPSHPYKDYSIAPAKYAASGTKELWVFDPLLAGPRSFGGPFRLQVFHRNDQGQFVRIYAGDGPAHSPSLGAWAVVTSDGRMLRIASDANATDFWLTEAEALKAEADAMKARVAALEAELAKR